MVAVPVAVLWTARALDTGSIPNGNRAWLEAGFRRVFAGGLECAALNWIRTDVVIESEVPVTVPQVRQKHRDWFLAAHRALTTAYPELVDRVGLQPYYVCPTCLVAWPEAALQARVLTAEHVPPESIGGKVLVLTCARCNHQAGHEVDSHLRKEADLYEFATGQGSFQQRRASLETQSGRVPIRLSIEGGSIQAFAVPEAVKPETHKAVSSRSDHRSSLDRSQCREGRAQRPDEFVFFEECVAFGRQRLYVERGSAPDQ